ncbi:MAG: hypothetical protein AABZ14_07015 [Candidatus Margulisiibacteriota bacterium]
MKKLLVLTIVSSMGLASLGYSVAKMEKVVTASVKEKVTTVSVKAHVQISPKGKKIRAMQPSPSVQTQ